MGRGVTLQGRPFVKAIITSTVLCSITLAGCGKKGFAAGAPPGTSAESVIQKFGEPDQKLPSPPFLDSLKSTDCPSKESIKFAWAYSPTLYDHALIYFDAAKRVVCVTEGGVFFMSHN